jgi:hypothetical protein
MKIYKASLKQHYWDIYKDRRDKARRQGIPFLITFEYFTQLAEKTIYCPIFTKVKLSWGFTINGQATDNSPSLDKIDPKLGYISGNCAIICNRANRIKNNGTAQEHRQIAEWQERQ